MRIRGGGGIAAKNDRGEGANANPGDSDIDGLYINEVYSCNPDWVELYNAGNEELHIGGFILQDDKGAEERSTSYRKVRR